MRELFKVSILVRGTNGEQIVSDDPALLRDGALPKPIQSVQFDIGGIYQLIQKQLAPNRATVTLDFSRPPLFDLTNASNAPTPNASLIHVIGTDSMWVSGLVDRITTTLRQGRVSTGWIHSRYAYDVALLFLGLPASLAVATIAARRLGNEFPSQLAMFLFFFMALVIIFRLAFSGVRWLLPYLEYSAPPQPMHRQVRVLLSIVILGVLSSLTAASIFAVLAPSH
jgi:hypothetical protein